jgi:hypothetical protein
MAVPTVVTSAHMTIDSTVGGNKITGTLTFEELKMPTGERWLCERWLRERWLRGVKCRSTV